MEEPWEFVQRKPYRQKANVKPHPSGSSETRKSHNIVSYQGSHNVDKRIHGPPSSSSSAGSRGETMTTTSTPSTLPTLSLTEVTEALSIHLDKLIDTGLCGLFQEVLPAYLGNYYYSNGTYGGDSSDDEEEEEDAVAASVATNNQEKNSTARDTVPNTLPPRIICLGLGSISTGHRNNNGIVQLATIVFIRRICELLFQHKKLSIDNLGSMLSYPELPRNIKNNNRNDNKHVSTNIPASSTTLSSSIIPISFYDPIFTELDQTILRSLVPTSYFYKNDEEWQKDLVSTITAHSRQRTILIMPHCPLRLNALVLQLLWNPTLTYSSHPLSSLLLIGNTLGSQESNKLGTADSISLLLSKPGVSVKRIPFDTCFNKPICTDPYIHSVYGIPWNSTSLHFFRISKSLGPAPDVYTAFDLE